MQARKTVTILFCDVAGSTTLGEQLDPESAREVIQRYFAEMRTVIERHGGTVEKFIGDAVMAVFGVPQVHEDDALRAVRAAADMQEVLARLNQDLERNWGTRLQARIGVNTGEVVVGDPAAGQSFVSGDAVNVAARLEQAAEPDQVLLGEVTYRLVRSPVIADPVEPLALKGKAEPVPAYRLVAVESQAEMLRRRIDSPLVGRERELAAIHSSFRDAVASSACRLVTLIGEAGVGKSRLTLEALNALQDEALVLRGRCLPYGEGITFWPMVEVLQKAANIDGADTPEEAMGKMVAIVPPEEDAPVVDRLAAILGLGDVTGAIQETFWAIRRCLEHLAAERPVAVAFDDVQWGEATFLDFVQYLATFATRRPLFILCLARPELLEARPDWAQLGPAIHLEPLEPKECKRLVANLLGGELGAEQVALQVEATAAGNPLFIEEMLRMLVDDGVLARDNGTWVLRGHQSRAGAPETVHAVIAARLDRLQPAERSVLQRASVIGEVFYWGAVVDLSDDAGPAEVGRTLQAMVRRDLIRPDPSSFAGEDAFRFRHLLIRDVAYETVPKRTRADLHERFLRWLESRAGERVEYDEILGYHAEQAHRYLAELGPVDERGATLGAAAAERLTSAGIRSFDRNDLPAAANLLSRAAALLPPLDVRRLGLLITQGSALIELGRLDDARAALDEAIAGSRATGERGIEARAALHREYIRQLMTRDATHAQAIAEAERAITVFEELGDDAGLAEAFKLLGIVRVWGGALEESLTVLEKAIAHARRAGDVRLELDARRHMAHALTDGPMPVADAIGRFQASLLDHGHDRTFRCRTNRYLARLEAMRGRFADARSLLAEGMDLAKELGLTVELAGGFQTAAAYVALLADDPETAEAELRPAVDTLQRLGDTGHLASVAPDLAWVLLEATGREREAIAVAELSVDWMADDVDAQIRWRVATSRALARLGESAEAERLAREAVSLAWTTDYVQLRARSQEALAEVLQRSGRMEEAAEAMRKAIAVHEAKGNVVSAAADRGVLESLESGAGAPGH